MKLNIQQRKVCCVSDIHVGVHQNSANWHDITLEWASWLTSELKSHSITDIIISGDLFHYRDEIAVNTIHVVTQMLNMWKDFNIVLLVGNHDAYYKDKSDINSLSILSGWSNITVISEPMLTEIYGKQVMFCPWGTSVEQIQKCDTIFGHFEIESFKLNQHKVCDTGIRSGDLLSRAPTVITGHFHLREERSYKNGKILYLGNPYQMDFGDVNGIKGYYLFDFPTQEYIFYQNNLSPTHQKIKLSDLIKKQTITSEVREIFKNNIVKLIVDRVVSPDDMDVLLRKFLELKANSITVDYDVNFNKFGLDDGESHDLSGVDIPVAIEEFVNLLEDIPNKQDIIEYTVDLYVRSR
jgi:DNA repair exonuclease SbcCD nuclease subunit